MGPRKHFNGAQWRLMENFCGLPALERRPLVRPVDRLDDLLNRIMGTCLSRSSRLQTLTDLWPQIVGATLSRLSKPYCIRGFVLTVLVSGDATAQELSLRQKEILREIHKLPDSAAIRTIRPFCR